MKKSQDISGGHNPLVSVVIPCLNRAHYLAPTLESVLGQNYPRIECIIIDGGSTDGTVDILKGYGARITWISEPDDGHPDAINKGWRMSRGDILAWLNADDLYVVPDAVTRAVSYLTDNPDVDMVYGDYSCITDENQVYTVIEKPRAWDLVYAVKNCDHIICQPSSFIRRSVLEKVNWIDPEFRNGKDHELWLRIGLVGTIRYAPLFLAYSRIGHGLSQRLDIGEAKVACNRKFFSLPNLPEPFNSPKFRRRAMSNAYLVGARYMLTGTGQLKPSLRFIFKAAQTDPWNAPRVSVLFIFYYSYLLLPHRVRKLFRTIRRKVKSSIYYQ